MTIERLQDAAFVLSKAGRSDLGGFIETALHLWHVEGAPLERAFEIRGKYALEHRDALIIMAALKMRSELKIESASAAADRLVWMVRRACFPGESGALLKLAQTYGRIPKKRRLMAILARDF